MRSPDTSPVSQRNSLQELVRPGESLAESSVRQSVILSRVQDLCPGAARIPSGPSISAFPAAMSRWPPASRANMMWRASARK